MKLVSGVLFGYTLAIWAALTSGARAKNRPVAAKDYWGKGPLS